MQQVEFEIEDVRPNQEDEEDLHVNMSRLTRDDFEENEEENEENEEDPVVNTDSESPELPPPPKFTPFYHRKPPHKGFSRLPTTIDTVKLSPLSIFSLLFPEKILDEIVKNTNAYAKLHNAGKVGRPWKDINRKELVVWIAIVIYQGLHKESSVSQYWNSDTKAPIHNISKQMTLTRFEQIKRYFHISVPDPTEIEAEENGEEDVKYTEKLEPLMSHIRETSKRLYVPKSNVSIDEMTVRFSGSSPDSFIIKNKPIPEGYKIISLCDSGYTYAFLPTPRIQKNNVTSIEGLNQTGNVVSHLVRQLPYTTHSYNVYMDNYFSSIKLFRHLRKLKIGACGTVRKSVFSSVINIDRSKKLDWNTRSGFVRDKVLGVFWQDNGPVTMLTTIHGISGRRWQVKRVRRRPRTTSTNGAKVRAVFGTESRKELSIPSVVDDYNFNMNGVDVADQLRSYHTTQLVTKRTWFTLFFWLLDTAIINSFLIAKAKGCKLSHKKFRHELVWELINSTSEKTGSLRKHSKKKARKVITRKRITKAFTLDAQRRVVGYHLPVRNEERLVCIWCSYQEHQKEKPDVAASRNRTYIKCPHCNVFLCCNKDRNYFFEYHTQ